MIPEKFMLAELSDPQTYDTKPGTGFRESLSCQDVKRLATLANYALGNQDDRVAAFNKLMQTRKGRLLVLALCENLQNETMRFAKAEQCITTSDAVAVMKYVAEETKNKANEDKDISMQSMYLSDAGDYLRIASFLQRNELKRAAEKATTMDTAAREVIPEEIWDFLRSYL